MTYIIVEKILKNDKMYLDTLGNPKKSSSFGEF